MSSLWLDRPRAVHHDPLPTEPVDDVVVGAGITGLTTALLLARGGRRVAVVEARHIGAVATGHTTAKVSVLQGTKLSSLQRLRSAQVARAYVEANQEGLAWVRRFCADHGVPTQERDAVVFAADDSELGSVRQEHDTARSLGLDVRWHDRLDVPFPHVGATLLPGQLQLDPMDLLDLLARQLRDHGGTIHEGARVRTVSWRGRPTVHLEGNRAVVAEHVVLATGVPILDRALTFAKVEPKRSYLLAFRGVSAPEGMYLSAGSSARSLRDVPTDDGTPVFLVGGAGHGVGRTRSERAHLDELRTWTAENFPGAVETHAWSAQDYSPYDGVPLVGPLPLGGGRIFYATGYDKWGMTNGVAAGLTIAARILGDEGPSWSRELQHGIPTPQAGLHAALMNAKVGASLTLGYAAAETHRAPDQPAEGEGAVGRDDLVPTGVSTVDGRTCRVLAVCTHLGGALKWNDAERSWDCPLHGSRFAPDGEVLEGPATRPLLRRD